MQMRDKIKIRTDGNERQEKKRSCKRRIGQKRVCLTKNRRKSEVVVNMDKREEK